MMEKQNLLTKMRHLFKEYSKSIFLVMITTLYSILLGISFNSFVNSLEISSWNSASGLWLTTFLIGLGGLIIITIRFSHHLAKSNSMIDRAIDISERSFDIAQKLSEIIEKPRNPRTLVEKFLSIKSVFIYYVDNSRVNALYQQVVGRKRLQEVTEVSVGEQGLGFSIGIKDIARGEMSDKSINKLSTTSQIQESSIDEQFLIVQSTLLRSDNVELGYEHSIYQIEHELSVDRGSDDAEELFTDDFAKWFLREAERLNMLSGFILLEAEFFIQEFDSPQEFYQMTYRRPMVQNMVTDPLVEFRITIAKDLFSINNQLSFHNHLGNQIKYRVFGHVSLKSEGTNNNKVIDIAPLVIYT